MRPKLAFIMLSTIAEAHQKMVTPVPYGQTTLNEFPLQADGEDFPCKLRHDVFEVTHENIMEIGEPQELSFVGSATHGGGSCQISLTPDREPTRSSRWSVIKSIEGGCFANRNLLGDSNTVNPYKFNFTIPDSITPGQYTLAWTWFTRRRTMYMNCAPITVTATTSSKISKKVQEPVLPDMFIANVNGCMTEMDLDVRFPAPGEEVECDGPPERLLPKSWPACVGSPSFGAAGLTSTTVAIISSPNPYPSSSNPSAWPSSLTRTSSFAIASVTPTYAHPGETSSIASSSKILGHGSRTLSGACSVEGYWNCVRGTSFQRCANGMWSAAQSMPARAKCIPGQRMGLAVGLQV